MFVGARVFLDRADVDTALVGKGAFADKGPAVERHQVGRLRDVARNPFELGEVFGREAGAFHFQAQDRNDGCQVGIAATLSVAVDRAVDHDGAGFDGDDAVGHCQAGVVVGVDAEPYRR